MKIEENIDEILFGRETDHNKQNTLLIMTDSVRKKSDPFSAQI